MLHLLCTLVRLATTSVAGGATLSYNQLAGADAASARLHVRCSCAAPLSSQPLGRHPARPFLIAASDPCHTFLRLEFARSPSAWFAGASPSLCAKGTAVSKSRPSTGRSVARSNSESQASTQQFVNSERQ